MQAGNNRARFDKLKADLYELFMAKGLISNMTEADMMTCYGRKLRSLGVDLGEAMDTMQDNFSEGEWTLINNARPVFSETDSLETIEHAEQRIPRVFSPEDVRTLSGNMLKDTVYRAAVRTEVVNHPVPVNEGDELNPQDLIGTMTANIENAAPKTMVTYDPGTTRP